MKSAAAVSGVATVEDPFAGSAIQFTVVPISASGTGTVTIKPDSTTDSGAGYEPLYDSAGAALTVDLSAQITHTIIGKFEGVKVTSDNDADTFYLAAG